MPSFLHDLRRLSRRNSVRADKTPSNRSSDSSAAPSNRSSSTLNTAAGTTTPPSTLPSERSSSNLQATASNATTPGSSRPNLISSQSNRYSILSASGNGNGTTPNGTRTMSASSPYAPRVQSVSDNSWVHQKVLLVAGQVADPAQQAFDGTIWVVHLNDSFPTTSWPVCDSTFKILVHLQPGPNRIRLDFISPKVPTMNGSVSHSSWININYLPLVAMPPLDLVILLAKDSPGTFDAVPERIQREGNGLDTAIKKFKMAAYLWQAFTGEQMQRNGFGRRCFRFEEEWQPGTLSCRDAEGAPTMRNEVKIHIVRSEKTLAELRDVEVAQQNPNSPRNGELFSFAMDDVRRYFNPKPGQTRYVSVLLLDAHWDREAKLIRGHAALGGGGDGIQLAVFGSHNLQSYPSCIEEVVPAFSDCTRTDTNYVANDANESGSNWEAANIGIGAHLHETGHLFGSPHQESGVMLRDYVRLNRTFTCREPFSTRTGKPGQRLCLPQDECAWHRLDCLRFRFHPCFRLPSDPLLNNDQSVQVWAVENGNMLITAATGVAWIEIHTEGDELCRQHIEYIDTSGMGAPPPRLVVLTEQELRKRLPADKQKAKLKLDIFSASQGKLTVDDFCKLAKDSQMKLANGQLAFRSGKLGASQMEGSTPQEVILQNAVDRRKLLVQVKMYHGFALDGFEFVYEDGSTQLFGKRGGKPGGTDFNLDTRHGEFIVGFNVRAGLWIDGLQILTNLNRRSEWYGNANGGSGHTLIPPRGYNFVGVSGSVGQWLDGFQLIISR